MVGECQLALELLLLLGRLGEPRDTRLTIGGGGIQQRANLLDTTGDSVQLGVQRRRIEADTIALLLFSTEQAGMLRVLVGGLAQLVGGM